MIWSNSGISSRQFEPLVSYMYIPQFIDVTNIVVSRGENRGVESSLFANDTHLGFMVFTPLAHCFFKF